MNRELAKLSIKEATVKYYGTVIKYKVGEKYKDKTLSRMVKLYKDGVVGEVPSIIKGFDKKGDELFEIIGFDVEVR